jgi:hypothetical protein
MSEMLATEFRWLIPEQTFDLAVYKTEVAILIEHENNIGRTVNNVSVQGLGFFQSHLDVFVGFKKRFLSDNTLDRRQ